ncbi:Eco47II family restriction endonuclease [Olivibacter sp. SDN3]|uniref:Eco47II family restriction endonuclease n=1 Tax=Olivibacter sp. SDN3 TaxID=2764720 RepID=UPI0016510448|nr:Eco47II family restriction endonuclease [Olivibacter sp. SDN3]QNL47895.1 Eco47II family restriction endonuclease [Olivibacter sp. SDN3]
MPKLKWINDQDLNDAVTKILTVAQKSKANVKSKFYKNVLDPFSAMIQICGYDIDYEEWVLSEETRQAQKTLQNHIGNFHQNILGSVQGWNNQRTGKIIDLVSEEKKIIAEVKNKHNTVTGGKLSDLYYDLDKLVSPKTSIYKGYTAYYVTVIPKVPIRSNIPFIPSDKSKGAKCPINEKIRIIDGASFYELVTGDKNALFDLFNVLPEIISDIIGKPIDEMGREGLTKFFGLAYG